MAVALFLATPAFADPATNTPAAPTHVLVAHAEVAHPAVHHPAMHHPAAGHPLAHQVVHPAHRAEAPTTAEADAADDEEPMYADSNLVWRQTGIASWYGGPRWHGHPTASGARYNQNALTAAHATLPIGTKVRVTLEGTDRSVVVVINDRPGTRRRIIDLSRGAAAALGILRQGVAVVTLSRM
jgi:rare lipoprotein A (peptidoglycan hydrolase)